MLHRTSEEDYFELNGIAKTRLHPVRMKTFFVAVLFFEAIMFGVTLFAMNVSEYITRPIWPKINALDWSIFVIQLILTLVFLRTRIAYQHQKIQATFLSAVTFLMSVSVYIPFFVMWEDSRTPVYVAHMGVISLLLGLVILVYCTYRSMIRVQKGMFRKGGRLLYDFQNKVGTVKVPLIGACVILAGSFARYASSEGVSSEMFQPLGYLFICIVLQYTLSIVMPEFFLLTYCKFRFESFLIQAPPELNIQVKASPKEIKGLSMPFQTLKYWAGWDMRGKKASFGALLIVWTELAIIMFILYALLHLTDAEGRAELARFQAFIGPAAIVSYTFALAVLLPVQLVLFLIQLTARMRRHFKKTEQ
ncbi:hypothetical protein [Cohnella fermenti]|uniref:Uncharacterized protein n=1 Tax=Cohnella fermenti TaxID=2565925 RepID=A0A4S4BHB2_9BACL|nr:hypothetical protein [Cohnella fermenti]THF73928.1 hypothetical protein E6C55_27040 [Cohnella fermenti]